MPDDKAIIETLRMELRTLRTELTITLERLQTLEAAIVEVYALVANKDRVS